MQRCKLGFMLEKPESTFLPCPHFRLTAKPFHRSYCNIGRRTAVLLTFLHPSPSVGGRNGWWNYIVTDPPALTLFLPWPVCKTPRCSVTQGLPESTTVVHNRCSPSLLCSKTVLVQLRLMPFVYSLAWEGTGSVP